MEKNKLKTVLMSSLILAGIVTDGSSLALAEDISSNLDSDKNIDSVQGINEKSTEVINGIRVNKKLIDINYSKGVTIVPKYIVIHDTDNRAGTADAMANRDYFANHPNANASAHYIVDDSNIVQVLEDTWRGWHIGDGGNGATVQNSNSIGIELAVNAGGNFDKTYENGIALTRNLMRKYNIPAQNIVMHNHASGKICSRMMIQDRPNMWEEFKSKAAVGMQGESFVNDGKMPTAKGKLINVSSHLNIRTQASATSAVLGNVYPNKKMNIYGEENGFYKVDFMGTRKTYGYVSKEYVQILDGDVDADSGNGGTDTGEENVTPINKKGQVSNISSSLNVRSGAGTGFSVIDSLSVNSKVDVNHEKDGWYNISYANGKEGYVSKNYIKIIDSDTEIEKPEVDENEQINKDGQVVNVSNGSSLNMRSGASINDLVEMRIPANSKVKVNYKTKNGWYNVSYAGKTGFVSANYIKVLVDVEEPEIEKPDIEEPEIEKPEIGESTTPINKDGVVANISSGSGLNVRAGAGTNHAVKDKLPLNTKVRVNYKTKNEWYNISYLGKTGFVSSDYIKFAEIDDESSGNEGNINKNGRVVGVSSYLNVRTGPSTSYSIKDKVSKGQKVKVNYEKDGWYNIAYNGKIGYVSKSYISIVGSESDGGNTDKPVIPEIPEITTKMGTVFNISETSALNIRSGAGTGYSVIGKIGLNAKVKVNSEVNGWYNIEYNGKLGFVSKKYIKIDSGTVEQVEQKGKVINIDTNLNVRSGRGTNHSVVGYILGDSIVTILDHKDGWHKIEFVANGNKKIGYVKDDFIKIL